jgi:hypothetical protein
MAMNDMWKNIKLLILRTDIKILIFIPLLFALATMILIFYIGKHVFPDRIPDYYYGLNIILCAFISSLSGVIQITRRETYGPMGSPIRGLWAILMGVLWVLFCLSIGAVAAYYLL